MPVAALILLSLLPLAWICWKLFNSLRLMEIHMGVGVVLSRYDNPALFWAVIGIQAALIGLLLAVIGYVTLVLPNHVMS